MKYLDKLNKIVIGKSKWLEEAKKRQEKQKTKKLEWKVKLINMYETILFETDKRVMPFRYVLFSKALDKLYVGVDPKKVETWVTQLEKLWRN